MAQAVLIVATLMACALFCRTRAERQGAVAKTLTGLALVDMARPHVVSWPSLYVMLFVIWYAITAWGVASTLAPEEPRTGLSFALLIAAAPTALRLGTTAELARASFALALAAQALAVVRFLSRGKTPDDSQRVALIIAASSLSDVAGPWMLGEASRDWYTGKWPALLTWGAISAWEFRCLMRARSPRG